MTDQSLGTQTARASGARRKATMGSGLGVCANIFRFFQNVPSGIAHKEHEVSPRTPKMPASPHAEQDGRSRVADLLPQQPDDELAV